MAYYYSASNRAFYCTEIASVDVMPADKVAVSDEAYKSLMAAQNAGKLIRPGAGGVPEAVDQPGGAATGITHEVTAATADTLGHVKIGAGVNVTKDGTISVDTEVLFRQDSWSTRIASTLYAVGDIVDCPYKRKLELVCTQAGTTGSGDLAEGGLTHGATVADGSVKWKVRAKIKTVNGGEPNASGEIDVDVGVKTVNGKGPDEAGNVNVDISSKRDHTIQVANADLNTLLEDKTWACSGTLKNTPIACTFCIVQAYDTGAPVSGNIVQVCYVPNQADNTVRTFWRNCNNGATFGKWSESGAVKTVNSIAPDASGEVTLPNATTSKFGLVRLAAEEDVLNESPQTAVCTQLIYEINEFRRKSTTYKVGDKVDCAFQYERFLECTKAGTTSADMLDTRDVAHGQVITDGSAEWTVRTHVRSVGGAVANENGDVALDTVRSLTAFTTAVNSAVFHIRNAINHEDSDAAMLRILRAHSLEEKPMALFVVAGQSNAKGSGTNQPTERATECGYFWDWSKKPGKITPIKDSVYESTRGTAWPAFARLYYRLTGRQVLILNVASGGSYVTDVYEKKNTWAPVGTLRGVAQTQYKAFTTALNAAGIQYTTEGLLWAQGEAEAELINKNVLSNADLYIKGTKEVWAWFREMTQIPKLPIFISRTGYHKLSSKAGYEKIHSAQETLPSVKGRVTMAFELAPLFLQINYLSDNVHYNQKGYNLMGRSFARSVFNYRKVM